MDENRSPGFALGLKTGPVQSMRVLAGGLVSVTDSRDMRECPHPAAEIGGGSFDEAAGAALPSVPTCSASGEHTDRYLDPPTQANGAGATDGAAAIYDCDLSDSDRIRLILQYAF